MYIYLLDRKYWAVLSSEASRKQEGMYFVLLCCHNIDNPKKQKTAVTLASAVYFGQVGQQGD